jgi:O-acetyl-ADP-ribose deacetylase (regulator of RNase III)
MIAQEGYGKANRGRHQGSEPNTRPPIRYDALEKCLHEVRSGVGDKGASIHMPKIGTGLAQGDWSVIEPIIQRTLEDLLVFVYEYDP